MIIVNDDDCEILSIIMIMIFVRMMIAIKEGYLCFEL
jgi:hypothetical protein